MHSCDGTSDEGPRLLEVQYWWTVHHIKTPTQVTLRNSGSSYLLQNGCLSFNSYEPVHHIHPDEQRLTQNLMSAAEVYIQRCNHVLCGDTETKL